MDPCEEYGRSVPDGSRDCHQCGRHPGFPNVKTAAREALDLEQRAAAAREDARSRNCGQSLEALEGALQDSHAVVNVDVGFLHHLLTVDNALYSAYSQQ